MIQPACWPDWLDDTWAKSAEKGAGGQPETLAQHTWYVLERLADFMRSASGLATNRGYAAVVAYPLLGSIRP